MKNSIFNLIEQASNKMLEPRLKEYAARNNLTIGTEDGQVSKEDVLNHLHQVEEVMFAQFTGKTFSGEEVKDLPNIEINEALNTSDVSIIFPRVISEILQEPTEPNLFLTNNLTDTIVLPDMAPLSIEFPVIDAIQAFELAEGQEYTTQLANIAQHQVSIRIKKLGVAAAITEETIRHSMWPILNLHLRMMSSAIDRKVESMLYNAMTQKAHVLFDNENADTAYHTTGKSIVSSGTVSNGSFSFNDLVKMFGTMLGFRYIPSHFLAHPLAWSIFAQDPVMKAQFYHGGQIGQGIWSREPSFDQSANFPFGVAYVPYYAIQYDEADTLSGLLSSLGSSLTTDLYLVDAKNSLYMATRGKTDMDQMENWFRDATMMKARKYVGISAKQGGKGMLKASKVRVVENQEPVLTMRQLTA